MKRLLVWFFNRTLLRFAGCLVTITLKSGATVRFRCDSDWGFKHTDRGLTQYDFNNVRTVLGSTMSLWFDMTDVVAITVRKWRFV